LDLNPGTILAGLADIDVVVVAKSKLDPSHTQTPALCG
jgi:hypothetical protein